MTKPMVFISYSHKDETWKDMLVKHLGVLQQEDTFDLWDDRRIGAGEEWFEEIKTAMDEASVAIFLVSADYLTSNFIRREEVPRLLERRKKEGLHIFPVIIKPCLWKKVNWLSQMNVRPIDGRAISGGTEHQIDADMVVIVEEIEKIISQKIKRPNLKVSSASSEGISKAHPLQIQQKTILPRVYDEKKIPPIGSQELPFYIWDAQNFEGFFYDVNDDLCTESLKLLQINLGAKERTIGMDKLVYSTNAQPRKLKVVTNGLGWNSSYWDADTAASNGLEQAGSGKAFDQGNYYIIGWQAEKYVALNGKVDKLAKLILEQGTSAADKKTLTVGETWEIGDGWTLTANSIDAKATPRQVWLTLSKDGVKKDDKVISSGSGGSPIYTYVEKSLAGENDVPVFVTYVDSVFAGATTDMVQLRYTWLISSTLTEIKSGDTYGVFTDATVSGMTLSLKNSNTKITLSPNTIVNLMGNLKFKVADRLDVLRFHPVIYKTRH